MICNMKKIEVAQRMNHGMSTKKGMPDWRKVPTTAHQIMLKESGKAWRGKKGKASLNSTGKNEGEHNYLGKDEQARA